MPTPPQLWTTPTALFDALIALTDEGLIIASPRGEALVAAAAAAVSSGRSAREALGPSAKILPFESISSVKANLTDGSMNIYQFGAKPGESVQVTVPNDEHTRPLLEALASRTGLAMTTHQTGAMGAAIKPLITLAVFAGITWGLRAWAASNAHVDNAIEQSSLRHGRAKLVVWLSDLVVHTIGPTGITIIGSVFCAGALWWFAKRVMNPPLMARLSKDR